ncbi:hypothetical protein ACFV1W_36840 [Kitasatospora sp. NPDC059648]|uniref:hypothetical protein n=1 Tax=Kitasatospora sp. NPDC059648 TaxID=3346894 RepID=UPI00368EF513
MSATGSRVRGRGGYGRGRPQRRPTSLAGAADGAVEALEGDEAVHPVGLGEAVLEAQLGAEAGLGLGADGLEEAADVLSAHNSRTARASRAGRSKASVTM